MAGLAKLGDTVLISNRVAIPGFGSSPPGRIDHGVWFEFFHTAERLLPHLRLLRPDLPMIVSCADVHHVRESRAAAYADHPIVPRARAWRTRRREIGV